MTRLWPMLLVVAIAVPFLAWGYDRVLVSQWLGSTKLDVEFTISEAGSGNPIPNARVEGILGTNLSEEQEWQEFVVSADTNGVAHMECRDCMCFGTRSGLGFTDTFAVHPPPWSFGVSAPGFKTSALVKLDAIEVRRGAHCIGPGKAKLSVVVSLHR